MSTQWRCAACEAVNHGGDTCAACGATVTQTVVQAPPAAPAAAPERTAASEGVRGDQAATEIPVREFPRRRLEPDRPDDGPYDVYDLFDLVPADDPDLTYERHEPIDPRPRVRVYGCCLPVTLGMMLAFLATVTLLAGLLLGAL